jgi:hypothetical protein
MIRGASREVCAEVESDPAFFDGHDQFRHAFSKDSARPHDHRDGEAHRHGDPSDASASAGGLKRGASGSVRRHRRPLQRRHFLDSGICSPRAFIAMRSAWRSRFFFTRASFART